MDMFKCANCGTEYVPVEGVKNCPKCGSPLVVTQRIERNDDALVTAADEEQPIEDDDAPNATEVQRGSGSRGDGCLTVLSIAFGWGMLMFFITFLVLSALTQPSFPSAYPGRPINFGLQEGWVMVLDGPVEVVEAWSLKDFVISQAETHEQVLSGTAEKRVTGELAPGRYIVSSGGPVNLSLSSSDVSPIEPLKMTIEREPWDAEKIGRQVLVIAFFVWLIPVLISVVWLFISSFLFQSKS